MAVNEFKYRRGLIERLNRIFPSCFIIVNDAAHTQGVPDILILFGNKWAMLEVKASKKAPLQPNQDYYVDLFDGMSFAAFIYPENEVEVLNDLQSAFGVA